MTAGPPRRRPLLRAHEDTRAGGDRAALERLTAFSDAVVAIAITLIVLPLVDRAMDAQRAADFFVENAIGLISALLSFVIVGLFWRAHHHLMAEFRQLAEHLRADDAAVSFVRQEIGQSEGLTVVAGVRV